MKNINLDNILDSATKQINKEHSSLQQFLLEEESTPVAYFTNRVLSWYGDNHNKQLLWEMFNKSINMSPVVFMGSLHSFVVNCLLDDSAFRIEWRKNYVDENHNLVWENGEHKTILSSKEDPDSFPIVLWDNDGEQNVHLLMEAMDEVELREDRRQKKYDELQDLFGKLNYNRRL